MLEEGRRRLGLLALLMAFAFAIDPFFYALTWVLARTGGRPLEPGYLADLPFYLGDLVVVALSLCLGFAARSGRVIREAARLLDAGLFYEVALCFWLALRTYWEYFHDTGMLPNLTWVPAVIILFPLIVPAAPRRMLAAALASAAMQPMALFLLDRGGQLVAGAAAYVNVVVGSAIAVVFAAMGSRVVHRLRRAVSLARELGAYRLEAKLGQGGMGEVWRARHRFLARPAAIKLIRPSVTGDPRPGVSGEALRRFEREAQVIAELRSPHTVDLFDFGVAADGAFYYVMELLDGLDIDALVKRHGAVSPERAVFILRQVCHSLSEAESRGLVHRDVKPANIFLCHYGEEFDFVKVLDFGIVKAPQDAAHEASANDAALTRENAVHGTPAFMAPEQAMGTAIDGRADVYAAGCVAYWLLTGQLVFPGENAMAVISQHIHMQPVAPSRRAAQAIPPQLDALVLSCLAKDPQARPAARDLALALAEIPFAAPWTQERAREWWAARSL